MSEVPLGLHHEHEYEYKMQRRLVTNLLDRRLCKEK